MTKSQTYKYYKYYKIYIWPNQITLWHYATRAPTHGAFVCKTGLKFINKSSIQSDMMWFDFVHKFSNQSEKMYVIQPDLTSFDPIIHVFSWELSLA
jgi:hypothetical protein